jgi:hypothetical protein
MQRGITHFMWGYQQDFRHAVEREAERILESLKPGLNPKVFLIGVRVNEEGESLPACVEPEIHHWAKSADFYDVLGDVAAIQKSYPESQLYQSQPIAQASQNELLFRRALRVAVLRRLEVCPARPQNIRIFASSAVERDGFLVLTITTVNRRVFDEVTSVESEYVRIHEYRSLRVPCSLLEAVINQIHERANEIVIQPDAVAALSIVGSADEIIRRAAVRFFSGLLYRVDRDSIMVGRAEEVFDTLSRLALAPYERAEPWGCVLFADKAKHIGTPVLTLVKPLPLKRARALRKLLVLASDGLFLRCNCENAFALVRISASGSNGTRPAVAVLITGRGKWEVRFDDKNLMVMIDGHPGLPKSVVDEQRLSRDLRRVIPSITRASAATFAQIGAHLAASGHGGIVVVTDRAVEEATRLSAECLPVEPTALTVELSLKLTQVDGALMCDLDGKCHAVGVILDGHASATGDRGRGARFNSAVRYIASCPSSAAAMVVSEDGGLDLLPQLKPTLARDELAARLAELEQLANSPPTPPDREREVDVINWIKSHEFYLSQGQSESANEWIAICEERFITHTDLRVPPQRLEPDPEFDPVRDLT